MTSRFFAAADMAVSVLLSSVSAPYDSQAEIARRSAFSVMSSFAASSDTVNSRSIMTASRTRSSSAVAVDNFSETTSAGRLRILCLYMGIIFIR